MFCKYNILTQLHTVIFILKLSTCLHGDDSQIGWLYLCLASLTTLHLQVPCKLHDCPTVHDHDVPVLIDSVCLDRSQLDLSTRQVAHVSSPSPQCLTD